jgi:peptidoglycan/LPS O-acetylase OafA/YrhL
MLNGWIGVDLFFVLSGFLITHHIFRTMDRNDGNWRWAPYLRKRALRIMPAYYMVLFLAVIGVFPYFDISKELLGPRTVYHLLFLQDYLPSNIVVAFWSLGVEEKFYIIAPLLIFAKAGTATPQDRMARVASILLIGIALRVTTAMGASDVTTYEAFFYAFRSPFHMTLDPILIGVLIAIVYGAPSEFPRLTSRSTAIAAFWIGILTFGWLSFSGPMMESISWWDKTLQPTVIAMAFGGITFGLVFGGGPAAVFRTTFLFIFARISYSLYLVHLPLLPVSMRLAEAVAPGQGNFPVFVAIFGTLSLLASVALHFAVEKPFLIVKERA